MQICWKRGKRWFKSGAYLGLIIIFVSVGPGCAGTRKTTTTETTVTTYPSADQMEEARNNEGYLIRHQKEAVVATSETTTTSETKAGSPGIISSTVHAIGYVIAIPFIVIGGLFRMIFGG